MGIEPHPGRGAAAAASAIVLIALLAAGGVVYWRITSSYGAAAATRRAVVASPSIAPASSVIGSLAVSPKVDLTCTLPVTAYSRRLRIAIPSGAVTLDGVQGSEGAAVAGNSYLDGRWLPVPPAWVSPDGRFYATTAVAVGNSG